MNKKSTFVVALIFIFFSVVSFAEGITIGTLVPAFNVKSGNDKILTLDMIKGKIDNFT